MFDEAPPSSNTATPSGPSGSVGGPTETASGPSVVSQPSGSGQGSRNSRGRMKMKKSSSAKNGSKNSEQNGSGNGHSKQPLDNEDSDSSDLEDALGSPNESTAALVRKVRRKSGLNTFDKELIRIVGQHLNSIGLKTSAEVLMAEAGTQLIHPNASNFKKLVLNGEWSQAVRTLDEMKNHLENPKNMIEMKFLLLEQKFLELISKGNRMNALKVLQAELSVLKHNQPRIHELSSYLMLSDVDEIARVTKSHLGSKATDDQARLDLMHRLQAFIPTSVMLPAKRLNTLLEQSQEFQTDRCLRHSLKTGNGILPPALDPSFLCRDHKCGEDDFPSETIQILTDHDEEVWFCRFSPDGLKLASGGKDKHVNIFDFDPETLQLKFARSLERHNQDYQGVAFFAWSPDSSKLAVCGPEDCDEVYVWNVDSGALEFKISHSSEDSLTTVAWSPDGRKIACGGIRGQFYQCDSKGTVLDHKEGVRVQALAYRKDNRSILAADTHHRIRSYNLEDEQSDKTIIQESHGVMTFTIDESDRYALLNIASQGIHLWSIEEKCLIRHYTGITQGKYTIHSCFGGGPENAFIATGSEDPKVYIYHIHRENPIAELTGHSEAVNCVTWNPVYPKVIVSGSDDSTLRVWGPTRIQRNNSSNGVKNGHDSLMTGTGNTADSQSPPYHCGNGVI